MLRSPQQYKPHILKPQHAPVYIEQVPTYIELNKNYQLKKQ
jgi:hypothetical protein